MNGILKHLCFENFGKGEPLTLFLGWNPDSLDPFLLGGSAFLSAFKTFISELCQMWRSSWQFICSLLCLGTLVPVF